nr:SulP family inorganic anion transporter [Miniimonas sp. S16]
MRTLTRVTTVRAALASPRRLRAEVLGGLVVALILIPESIAFSVIVGVDPRVGLFTTVTMSIAIAFTGGRPAMISAATGAVSLVVAPLAHAHGVDYLVATVLLAGVVQVVVGVLGVARLMRFIPRSVMVGFVNALASLVFISQLPQLVGVPWLVYPLVVAGVVIIWLTPRLTTAIPPPLVAVVVLSVVVLVGHLAVPTVGDQGALPTSLPTLGLPDVPLTFETLRIIGPTAVAMALVGLMESLLTAKLVDDLTDTPSSKTREAWGQGVANVVTGLFGGMGGCAEIGPTIVNVRQTGARSRVSTFLAGALLLALVLLLGDAVAQIPMAALVAVMLMVAFTTFEWRSIAPRTLRRMPKSETAVMLTTLLTTIVTHNLAIGVILGVLVAGVLFANRVAQVTTVTRVARVTRLGDTDEARDGEHTSDGERTCEHPSGNASDGEQTYAIEGELFFASANAVIESFDYTGDPDRVVLDLTGAQVWDASGVAALDAVVEKYARHGTRVRMVGLDERSAARLERLRGHLGGLGQ